GYCQFNFIFLLRQNFALFTQAGVQWCNLGSLQLCLPGSSASPDSASQVAEIIGAYHHNWLIFAFLVKTGLYHVGQFGLELPISGKKQTSP
uniref:Uncharacterized protein n=1 Tax=Callithrix jacchus TaxID=9483 RepID=A0A5F4W2S1_CALJA